MNGNPAAGNTGRFQYTGQLWLNDAGVYHYKNRAYHPGLMRFLQADPIGVAGGINLYAYVGGDPVNFTDPWGLSRLRTYDRCEHIGDKDGVQYSLCWDIGSVATVVSPGGYDALRSFEQRGGEDGGGGGGGGINGEGVDGSKDAMETLKRLCAQRNRQGGPNLSSPYLRNDPTIGHYSLSEGLMGGGLSLSFTPRGSTFAIDVFLTDSSITIAPIPKLPPSVDVGLTLGSALSANSGSISFSNQFGLLPAHATIEVGAIKRAFISPGIETRIDIRIPGISQHGRYNIDVLYDRCGLL